MATERANDLQAFKGFIDQQLSQSGKGLTLDEALSLWESENATDEERQETLKAIQQGLDDIDAGRTRPAHEAMAEIRLKHGLAQPGSLIEDFIDLDFEAFCAQEGDDSITLEEVLKATSKIPGSMSEAIIEEERAERF